MGRHSEMETLVERTGVSPEARDRLKVILRTLFHEMSVREGCAQLGVGRTRFQDLRGRMLRYAGVSLEARAPGRPRRLRRPEAKVEARLQHRVVELEHDVLRLEAELDLARRGVAEVVAARRLAKAARR